MKNKNEMKWRLAFMGKKKQIKRLAEANIRILRSGKLKVSKNKKIPLKPFVKESVENSIVSRLDGIISKEDVIIDTENLRCDITSNLTDEIKTVDLANRAKSVKTQTIVVSTSKKAATNIFDFINTDAIGMLLRTSTLGSIYSEIKDRWVDINKDDSTHFTNVLFIPKILVFLDFNTGKIRKTPLTVNLLIVATPSMSKMNENNIEEISQTDATSRVIADILDSAIKCGCKSLVLYPYGNKITQKDKSESGNLWFTITSTQRVIENIESIIFTFDDDNESDYIVFNASKNRIPSVSSDL